VSHPRPLACALAACLVPFSLAAENSAASAIERLKQGNQEFAAGRIDTSKLNPTAGAVGKPIASILSCSDQSLPAEIVFGQGSGDLFVVRVSGAVANQDVLASLEYSVEQLGSRMVVVMGHTSCGVVKAALDSARPGTKPPSVNLQSLLNFIRPALQRPQERADPWTSAVYASVEQTIADIIQHSLVIGELARAGDITMIGAVYQPDTGKVAFSKPVQFSKLKADQPLSLAHGGKQSQ
jgi:carbonic anhydrase